MSASLVRLATFFGMATVPPAIALPADSVQVNVQGPASMPAYIETIDTFDNNALLQRGRNQLPTPVLLRDAHWQHDVFYPITQTGTYRLVPDEHNQYWLIKTGDAQRDAALNFYVVYRRPIAPITRPDQQGADMLWHLARSKSTQRDSLLQLQLSRQLLFLQHYAQEHQLTQQQIGQWRTILQHTMRYRQLTLTPKLLTPTYIQRLAQLAPTFTDDSSLYMPPYQLAALQCAFMVAAHRSNTLKPPLTQRYDADQSAFNGQTRDLILTRLLLLGAGMLAESAPSTPSRQEVSQLLTRYYSDCQTASYASYVRRATSLSRNVLEDGSLLTHTNQVVPFSQATTRARLTYVDFWASWCAPCRAEMPHSRVSCITSTILSSKSISYCYRVACK